MAGGGVVKGVKKLEKSCSWKIELKNLKTETEQKKWTSGKKYYGRKLRSKILNRKPNEGMLMGETICSVKIGDYVKLENE